MVAHDSLSHTLNEIGESEQIITKLLRILYSAYSYIYIANETRQKNARAIAHKTEITSIETNENGTCAEQYPLCIAVCRWFSGLFSNLFVAFAAARFKR